MTVILGFSIIKGLFSTQNVMMGGDGLVTIGR
jgi:hypothetical protein